TNVSQPSIYLDSIKVEPIRKGSAVLTQRVGTTKLATDGAGGQLMLCEIVVKKNRITTVTVTVLERPPRCQCRNAGSSRSTCSSERAQRSSPDRTRCDNRAAGSDSARACAERSSRSRARRFRFP